MTTAVAEFSEHAELAEAPDELLISEAVVAVDPSLREGIVERARAQGIELREGEDLLQIIRPCVGKGRGTREYGPEMLEADAPNWVGARMFRNHLTDKERRALEGLPRPIEQLAGRIRESWWDGDVPPSEDGRYGQGGVYGVIKPTRFIREMLDDDPGLIESSINALATSLRPERRNGKTVAVVEGIRLKPRSVDWVTEGGAGGRVLRESAHEQEAAVLESLRDEEITEYLEQERPGLLEALREQQDGSGDDTHNRPNSEEEQVPETITPEALVEALADDATRDAVIGALREHISFEPEGYVRADEFESLVESKLADRSDLIRIEARGDLERQIELRDLRDRAAALVEAAKLHPRLAKRITEEFALNETGEPTEALAAIEAEFDSDGNLTKSALDALTEAVTTEIEDSRAIMSDLRPTRVRGAGREGRSHRLTEASSENKGDGEGEGDKDKPKVKQTTGSSLADELLESAGFSQESLSGLWATGL